jgi:hypothetical protein
MKSKVLAKAIARTNGGDIEKARELIEQRRRDIDRFSYEKAFMKDSRRLNYYDNLC